MRNGGQTRSWLVTAIVMLGVAPGCVTTYTVGRPPSRASIASINEASRGRDLEVRYRPTALAPPPLGAARTSLNETDNASIARADATTITFVKRDGSEQPVATNLIRTVSVTHRGRGALYGSLLGSAVGVALGALAVLADPPCQDPQDICIWDTNELIVPVALATGLIGSLIGAGSGALVGHHTTYIFDETP